MSKEVNTAIGTQRQFAKQPELPYALRLRELNASAGISRSVDYDAELLAKSLNVLPKGLMALHGAIEKGKQENAALVNVDKMLAGKTEEDLRKFDRMVALQNVEGHNMSHNQYAMAALDQGIGKMAGQLAKQEWANLPESQKPKSVEESVGQFNQLLQDKYNAFGDGVKNRVAFDKGYYDGAIQSTLQVANEADQRINDDKQQKMRMLASTEIQDLIYSGTNGQAFADGVGISLRKLQLGCKDRQSFMKVTEPLMEMIVEQDYTTERLNAIADFSYDGETKIGDMVNTYPYYKKIAHNFDIRVADDIAGKAMRSDGTIDMNYAYKLLSELPPQFSSGSGVPNHMLPMVGGGTVNAPENMKGSLGLVGGALLSLGYNNAQFTTSNNPNMVAIDLGSATVSQDKQDSLKSYFQQYFSDVSFIGNGDELTMQLGGYNGKMKGANPREESASAYTTDRAMNIMKRLRARSNDVKRQKKERQIRTREDTSVAALSSINQIDAVDAIYNADLPDELKDDMISALESKNRRTLNAMLNGTMTPEQMAWYNYEKGIGSKNSLAKDWALKRKFEDACKDPNYPQKDFEALQADADEAVDRINLYWEFSSGGKYSYSEKSEDNITGDKPKPNVNESQQVAIQRAKEWVSSNPKKPDGTPLTHDEILLQLNRKAGLIGLKGEELIDLVFEEE